MTIVCSQLRGQLHTIVCLLKRRTTMRMTMELALGREIMKAREVLQQSQEALAFEAGIHRTYVSLIERGKKSLTLATRIKGFALSGDDSTVAVCKQHVVRRVCYPLPK